MNKICYRFSKKGTLHAPVRVRSSGHYLVEPDWHDLIMRKSFLELYWCVSGCGEFRLGSRSWQLHPGEICSYFPGDVHQVAACEEWEYCWLTIDGEFCADVIKGFGLTREPHRAGPCPQELFSRLRHELAIPGIDAESRAALIGYEILLRTVMPEKIPNIDLGRRFMAEVARRLDDPELNISELAAELGVHRTTLMELTGRGQKLREELDSLIALPRKSHADSIRIVQRYQQLEHIVQSLKNNDTHDEN